MVEVLDELKLSRASHFGRLARLPAGAPRALPVAAANQHDYCWRSKLWVCKTCLFTTRCPSSVSRSNNICRGNTPFDSLLRDPRGHSLKSAVTPNCGIIVFCERFWFFGSVKPRKLLLHCKGPPVQCSGGFQRGGRGARHTSKFYLSRHIDPVSRKPFRFPVRLHD